MHLFMPLAISPSSASAGLQAVTHLLRDISYIASRKTDPQKYERQLSRNSQIMQRTCYPTTCAIPSWFRTGMTCRSHCVHMLSRISQMCMYVTHFFTCEFVNSLRFPHFELFIFLGGSMASPTTHCIDIGAWASSSNHREIPMRY